MKRLVLAIMIGLQFLLFSACGGYTPSNIPQYDDMFTGNQAWVESNYDLFFHHSSEYMNYEYAYEIEVGCLRTEGKEFPFTVTVDAISSFYFISPSEDGLVREKLFVGDYIASGNDFYEIKVHDSAIPDIIPNGTVLHFDISDIAVKELYVPDFLGNRLEEPADQWKIAIGGQTQTK